MTASPSTEQPRLSRDHALAFVLLLSFVSLFADIVYEGARSVTGPFLNELGASALIVGAVSGFGELLGYALRLLSGRAADQTRAYWTITIVGYIINLLAVPALALVGNWQTAALLLLLERTGKAIRGPARDVMLSAAGSQLGEGFAFGLHQALDQVGAIVGPLLLAAVIQFNLGARWGLGLLVIPAAVALILLLFARAQFPDPEQLRVKATEIETSGLNQTYWLYLTAAGLVAAGTVDYPLIAYHFKNAASIAPPVIPLLYSLAMATDGLAGLLLGKLFDRVGVTLLSITSLFCAIVTPLVFILTTPTAAFIGVALWGIGLGAQSTIMKAMVAKLVSPERRGAAYGWFGLVYGVAWFAGSLAMGALYAHSLNLLVAFSVTSLLLSMPLFFVVARRMKPAD